MRWHKTFHISWLFIAIVLALYFTSGISQPKNISFESEKMFLDAIPVPTPCSIGYCTNLRDDQAGKEFLDYKNNLEALNGIFPFLSVARVNVYLADKFDTNLYLQVTKPEFKDKINVLMLSCNNLPESKFDSTGPPTKISAVSLSAVDDAVSQRLQEKYAGCVSVQTSLAYLPSKKIEVGPNELVKMTTDGDKPYIQLKTEVQEKLTLFSRALIFFIYFVLLLGAGLTTAVFFSNLMDKKKGL